MTDEKQPIIPAPIVPQSPALKIFYREAWPWMQTAIHYMVGLDTSDPSNAARLKKLSRLVDELANYLRSILRKPFTRAIDDALAAITDKLISELAAQGVIAISGDDIQRQADPQE